MKYLLIILSILFFNNNYAQPSLQWGKSIGGTGTTVESVSDVVTDQSNNVYMTGVFTGTVDFDPGVGVFNLTSDGSDDGYILKLDQNGDFVWAFKIGSTTVDSPTSINIDSDGNIYVSGYFSGTVDFDPGVGIFNKSTLGGRELYVLKVTSNMEMVWVKTTTCYNSSSSVSVISSNIDATNNIYLTGFFISSNSNDSVDFDPGIQPWNLYLSGSGNQDAFVLKLDSSGNFIWAHSIEGDNNARGETIAFDINENPFLIGEFQGNIDLDPGLGVSAVSSNGGFDIFIIKFDINGNYIWNKTIGGVDSDYVESSAVDNINNLYLTGWYTASIDFDPGIGTFNISPNGGVDCYVLKLDNTGNFVYAYSFGSNGTDVGNDIIIDNDRNVYVTGTFQETVDFDPLGTIHSLTSSPIGGNDLFLIKLFKNGGLLWVESMGSTQFESGQKLTLDSNSDLFLSGVFQGTVDFDPSAGIFNMTSNGLVDIFIVKFGATTSISLLNQKRNSLVYPNPTSTKLTIDTELSIKELEIFDISGRKLKSFIPESNTINVDDLPNGTYFIKIVGEENVIIKKFIKS